MQLFTIACKQTARATHLVTADHADEVDGGVLLAAATRRLLRAAEAGRLAELGVGVGAGHRLQGRRERAGGADRRRCRRAADQLVQRRRRHVAEDVRVVERRQRVEHLNSGDDGRQAAQEARRRRAAADGFRSAWFGLWLFGPRQWRRRPWNRRDTGESDWRDGGKKQKQKTKKRSVMGENETTKEQGAITPICRHVSTHATSLQRKRRLSIKVNLASHRWIWKLCARIQFEPSQSRWNYRNYHYNGNDIRNPECAGALYCSGYQFWLVYRMLLSLLRCTNFALVEEIRTNP